jgi:hypothetical protein
MIRRVRSDRSRSRSVCLVALATLVGACGGSAPAKPKSDGGAGSGGGAAGSAGAGGATGGTGGAAGQGGHAGTGMATTGMDGGAGEDGQAGTGAAAAFYALAYTSEFGTLNPRTGVFAEIGVLGAGIEGGDLTRSPGGKLYGLVPNGQDPPNQDLVIIDPASVTWTLVGNIGLNRDNGVAIKFRQDGVLFAASFTDLYTIDPSTAQSTHVGALGAPAVPPDQGSIDLSFDANGNLFFQATASQASADAGTSATLYSVNTSTGAATPIGPIGFEVIGMEFAQGTLYGFTRSSQVITIDPATGAGTALSSLTPSGVKVFAAAPIAGSGGASDAAAE